MALIARARRASRSGSDMPTTVPRGGAPDHPAVRSLAVPGSTGAVDSPRVARRRLAGLERVLGTNALFSTAYGNVGSSIYYALGLVAALALGFTPLVFVLRSEERRGGKEWRSRWAPSH